VPSGYTSVESTRGVSSLFGLVLVVEVVLMNDNRLFPYLRFLKANYSMDWKTFQKYFCDTTAPDSYTRISTLLSCTMMRRTMKTTILNRPIITLPPPHPEIIYIQFSPEEELIYRIVSQKLYSHYPCCPHELSVRSFAVSY
jgi:hypothetical protein